MSLFLEKYFTFTKDTLTFLTSIECFEIFFRKFSDIDVAHFLQQFFRDNLTGNPKSNDFSDGLASVQTTLNQRFLELWQGTVQ